MMEDTENKIIIYNLIMIKLCYNGFITDKGEVFNVYNWKVVSIKK